VLLKEEKKKKEENDTSCRCIVYISLPYPPHYLHSPLYITNWSPRHGHECFARTSTRTSIVNGTSSLFSLVAREGEQDEVPAEIGLNRTKDAPGRQRSGRLRKDHGIHLRHKLSSLDEPKRTAAGG